MKIWSVFSLVIVFHLVVIGLLLVQPGCQSKPASPPEPAAPARADAYAETAAGSQLDPSFNAGVAPATAARPTGGRTLSSPTRPATTTRTPPSTGQLEPVLQPVRESVAAAGTTTATREYSVVKGDTLSLIASRNRTTVREIKALNNLKGDTIRIGQKLLLPDSAAAAPSAAAPAAAAAAPAAAAPAPTSGTSYVVQPGDTPIAIARKFGVSSAELMTANRISDPRKLYVGQKLMIPQSSVAAPAQAAAPATAAPRQTAAPAQDSARPVQQPPVLEDPMSTLEALEDEDLPFVEVQTLGDGQPGN